jgi:hypothetical protein
MMTKSKFMQIVVREVLKRQAQNPGEDYVKARYLDLCIDNVMIDVPIITEVHMFTFNKKLGVMLPNSTATIWVTDDSRIRAI